MLMPAILCKVFEFHLFYEKVLEVKNVYYYSGYSSRPGI